MVSDLPSRGWTTGAMSGAVRDRLLGGPLACPAARPAVRAAASNATVRMGWILNGESDRPADHTRRGGRMLSAFLPLPAWGRGPGGEVQRRAVPRTSPPNPLPEAGRGDQTSRGEGPLADYFRSTASNSLYDSSRMSAGKSCP